jgi:hypothetical protein
MTPQLLAAPLISSAADLTGYAERGGHRVGAVNNTCVSHIVGGITKESRHSAFVGEGMQGYTNMQKLR